MKKLLIGSIFLLSIYSTGHADPITWKPVTSGMPSMQMQAPMPGSYGSSGGYQGSSGAQYQYDMNNPVDRNRYSTDLDAQRRDQIQGSVDVGTSMDSARGQYGGGFIGR